MLNINLGDGLGDDLDDGPVIFRSVSQRRSGHSNDLEVMKADGPVALDGVSRQSSGHSNETTTTDDQGRKKRSMSRLFSWHRHRRERASS